VIETVRLTTGREDRRGLIAEKIRLKNEIISCI
jgi:hypothetical protein